MYLKDPPDLLYLVRMGLEREIARGTKFFTLSGVEITSIVDMMSILFNSDGGLTTKMSDNRLALTSFQLDLDSGGVLN